MNGYFCGGGFLRFDACECAWAGLPLPHDVSNQHNHELAHSSAQIFTALSSHSVPRTAMPTGDTHPVRGNNGAPAGAAGGNDDNIHAKPFQTKPVPAHNPVGETSRYQTFVKAMTAKLKAEDPSCNQTDRMKSIGVLWGAMHVRFKNLCTHLSILIPLSHCCILQGACLTYVFRG